MQQEQQYLDLLQKILNEGDKRMDRTGVGILALFGAQMRFDLSKAFPLLTTKRVWWKGVVHELLWLLSGSSNIKYLTDNDVHIWDAWSDENGELNEIYGVQWRAWEGENGEKIDQISNLIEGIKNNPFSRRHIVSAWNVSKISKMSLPPCHILAQFDVSSNNKLSCCLTQRSADFFLGSVFNIASYSLLTHMIASVCNLEVGELVYNTGNTHVYLNHLDQAKKQLLREPRDWPQLVLKNRPDSIFDFKYEDFEIVGYDPHPTIKAPIAV